MDFSIRDANMEDCKDIVRMIKELAEDLKMADDVKIKQRDLKQDGFSKNPFFHGIVAEVPEQHRTKDGHQVDMFKSLGVCLNMTCGNCENGHTKIGYALYFYSYSTWVGRAIYMDDLYVMPEFRGKGIGRALMSKVAQLGVAAGCKQLSFTVLACNQSSLDFYFKKGCSDLTDIKAYHCMRCEGEALQQLAQPSPNFGRMTL